MVIPRPTAQMLRGKKLVIISLVYALAALMGITWGVPGSAAADNIFVSSPNPPHIPPKTVVLTFDDGPSPYTPQILHELVQAHVPATFFVVGDQATQYPGMLARIYDAGDEVGNHTFTHANLESLPNWRLKEELNLDELVIVSQTGHESRLIRPPYLGSDSLTASSTDLIYQLEGEGYIVTGEDIDTGDWRRPGVDKIVEAAEKDAGGIILMHDGGGNRQQTVQALPEIIAYYKARGFHFMTVSQALGLARDQVMPPATATSRAMGWLAGGIFAAWAFIGIASRWVMVALIAASFSRMLLVLSAALVQARRKRRYSNEIRTLASIIVPAYNEEPVIAHCLRSLLKSDYPDFEIIVVDDGSRDGTIAAASQVTDPRIRVVTKQNGGKASALNYGIQLAQHDIVIAIDADTVFQTDTLRLLLRHFDNPRVGAVSGNTKIANRHRLITKLQSIEYVIGFNLDRRMGDLFDCITVVPGAIGAFRKEALERVGGFAPDTLAEDTDLTLAIKELGYSIIYDARAIAHTEAPATVKDLLKQRFRWTFGTMQAVWKHRRSFLNPRQGTLGMVGLPYLVFYQIFFPLISPFFDVALVLGLLAHRYEMMLVSLAVYFVADIISSAVALLLDHEPLWQLWILIPQRIFYRQLMYYVIVKSAYYVLRGRLVGWGKLKREGAHLATATTS